MNIIEQAAKRLRELERAGVDVPWILEGHDDVAVETPAPSPAARADRGGSRQPLIGPPNPIEEEATTTSLDATPPHLEPIPKPTIEWGDARSRIVEIDLQRLARSGFIVPGAARSQLSDELRVLKRPLLKNARRDVEGAIPRGNLIQVTSAVPGEGKTFTAINLALSLSMEVDHAVLLVDADAIRPSVFSRLGLQADRGLMDVLRDPSIELSEVMCRTNVPKLSLLPPGPNPLNSTELIASGAMETLLDDLATRYPDRIVIFDAPPLLAATESRVLASRVGQVVVVVEAGRTRRNLVSEAFSTISNCPVVLPVLNKYSGPPLAGPYGY